MLRRRVSSCPHRPGPRWTAALLLIALLCSQSAGLLHRIVHAAALEQPRGGGGVAAGARDSGGSLARLFAGHPATHSLCLVFDQIGHSSPLPATPAPASAAPVPAIAPQQAPTALAFGTTRVPFEARGPPLHD